MAAGALTVLRQVGNQGVARSLSRLISELKEAGISDPRVLESIQRVPRTEFVGDAWRGEAYRNRSLPIGLSQTISQPYIVALMTQTLLQSKPMQRVLEIGTGSGYQTAVLSSLVETVFSVERLKALSETARSRLRDLGYRNIHFAYADGTQGWAAHAPYDGILVTAAAAQIPNALREQLAPGGRLVIPVGDSSAQTLRSVDRIGKRFVEADVVGVSFVPLLDGRG